MKTYLLFLLFVVPVLGERVFAQNPNVPSDLMQISETLMDYIEGTATGDRLRLRRAFHPDFKLYTVTEQDSLRVRSGEAYIMGFKEGVKVNRLGRIVAIDYEKDAATAKVEIVIPNWRVFTDYFLLLKYEEKWKIVHKSYTWQPIHKEE
ncbi:MAG TPA: nuclear transport factor 2 family protein [Rhodothermales bacterium]|nr:nuclear transport factor 2 family protein [Rhodothermales bacterium]